MSSSRNAHKCGFPRKRSMAVEIIAVIMVLALFGIPFSYVILNSAKTRAEALQMRLSLPEVFEAPENYRHVFTADNYMVARGFANSTIITVAAVAFLIVFASMAGFVLQRRKGKATTIANFLALAGLMIPPAIVPTIWVLDAIGVYRSLSAMVLVQIALQTPFSIMLYRAFMVTIPREIDEAAFVEGCGAIRYFFSVILPLLKPVTATVILLTAVFVYNDFANALYFLPGADNVTVQITMFNFFGRYASSWNLLFANVVLISIPPLILFVFFSRRIVSGMVAGAIKG